MTPLVKVELREIASRYPDGRLMYPGTWRLTYLKPPHMPWQLIGMEPA